MHPAGPFTDLSVDSILESYLFCTLVFLLSIVYS